MLSFLGSCLLIFLATMLWGVYFGARSAKGYRSTRITLPRRSTVPMFVLVSLAFLFAALQVRRPVVLSEGIAAALWLAALIAGVISGFRVGRTNYTLD